MPSDREHGPGPWLTAGLPGCGGLLKAVPEDFVVEELSAYEPCGEGEHLMLWVEKVGLSTPDVARALAKHLGVAEREVGWAGLKDRQAVTRQYLSVPARFESGVAGFSHPRARVLRWGRHRNKLRTGHLKGNRFRIRVRDVSDPGAAQRVLEQLQSLGVPNYFGEQRFGRSGDNAVRGRDLLLGGAGEKSDDSTESAGTSQGERRGRGRFDRKLLLSALQSQLFNRALAARVREGTLGVAKLGDVLKKSDTGGEFVCEEPAVDQPRVERFEVCPAGPLFGPKMTPSAGEVALAEARLLEEEGLSPDDFARGGRETQGARRPYRIRLAEARLEPEGSDLWVEFLLPSGSYATVVLGELMKTGAR